MVADPVLIRLKLTTPARSTNTLKSSIAIPEDEGLCAKRFCSPFKAGGQRQLTDSLVHEDGHERIA